MGKLEEANAYVTEHQVAKEELPAFHVAPLIGWMNDPNGFSVYQGKIHLFYQYHPYSEVWGPMHWGHCVTEDFIKWENLPVALAPDQQFDMAGCFSGTGLETEKGHLLAYTGVMEEECGGEKKSFQNQCLAIGDGTRYKKLENNPVITGNMMPANFSREDFRDPKIWKEADGYYLLAGNKTRDGMPQVVLFHSWDLAKWEFVSVLAKDEKRQLGCMWECPDFFAMDDQYVLIASPQDLPADEELHNGNNSVYFLGDYDKMQHEFHSNKPCLLDEGLDFYAPQTLLAPDGRRIMIGWMQSWDSSIRPASQKWSCMMTLPRELKIVNGRILQSPVREIEAYHTNPVHYEKQTVMGECKLPGIKGRILDLSLEILSGDYREFTISFAKDERFHTDLTYRRDKELLEFDRTYSGMVHDTISFRRVKIKIPKETLKLRLILDKYSVEIFVNDGEQVISSTFYTPLNADAIRFTCDGLAMTTIQKYTISV